MEPVASGEFDNYKHRELTHPVSDCGTVTHLIKGSLGSGILSMPVAFRGSGLILGLFGTIIVSLICSHGAYILVASAHEIYRKTGITTMTFGDVAEEACKRGPKWNQKFGPIARQIVTVGILLTHFTGCSCYIVIIAKNFQLVASHYMGHDPNVRIIILMMLVPFILLVWIPNLKYLVAASMVANIFMGLGLGITLYYIVIDLPPVSSRPFIANIRTYPEFLAITVFSMEAIGVMMPLENNMENPEHFLGICGVLSQGMCVVTIIYMMMGFLGYLKYGDIVEGSVTLNLPKDELLSQSVQILIALAVFFTFGLQFYVPIEIVWNGIKEHFPNKPLLANYIMRTILVTLCVLLAVAVPSITPFVALIGSIFFSTLGLVVPVYIEVNTFWEKGFGILYWKIWKDIIMVLTAFIALIFGSKASIEEIIQLYVNEE